MLRTTLHLTTIRGIPLRLHISLLFIVPLLALSFAGRDVPRLLARAGLDPAALRLSPLTLGLLLALGVFVAVALHELGHALVARARGAQVRGITLMALGGVTELADDDPTPGQELWTAFAGPLVNLALAALSWLFCQLPGLPLDALLSLTLFAIANLVLALFNLLPAFPLDGGRMLRAALRLRLPAEQATHIATTVGRLFGVAGALLGLLHGLPFLALVGGLVFLGASQEQTRSRLPAAIEGLRAAQAMGGRLVQVYPDTTAAAVARHLLARGAQAAVVRGPDGITGVITAEALRRAPAQASASGLTTPPLRVTTQTPLSDILEALRQHPGPALVFDDANAVVGLVTTEDLLRAADLQRLARGLQAAEDRLSLQRAGS